MRKSRSSRKGRTGILSRLWAIPGGILNATGNSAGIIGRSVGSVARDAVKTVNKVGNTYARKTNNAITKAISRKRSTRKNRTKSNKRK